MAVIINDFEVITEDAPQAGPGVGGAARAPAAQPPGQVLAPDDVAEILCHQAERAARVRAH